MKTVSSVLATIESALSAVSDDAKTESRWIVEAVLDCDRTQLLSRLTETLSEDDFRRVTSFVDERLSGRPIQYVLGSCFFMGQRYLCCPGVLIPRPETELLVEQAMALMDDVDVVLECGFGSGVVSIELARRFADKVFYAWDISETAHELAQENAELNGVSGVSWNLGDFFADEAVWRPILTGEKRVLLLSNPPYINRGAIAGLDTVVRDYEPHLALDGGEDGLDFYRNFLAVLAENSVRHVALLCECGFDQSERLLKLFGDRDFDVSVYSDFSGHVRGVLTCPKIGQ